MYKLMLTLATGIALSACVDDVVVDSERSPDLDVQAARADWRLHPQASRVVAEWLYAPGGPFRAMQPTDRVWCDANGNLLGYGAGQVAFTATAPASSSGMGGGCERDTTYFHDDNYVARIVARIHGTTLPTGLNTLDHHWAVLERSTVRQYGPKPVETAPMQGAPCPDRTADYRGFSPDQQRNADVHALNAIYFDAVGDRARARQHLATLRAMWIAGGRRYLEDGRFPDAFETFKIGLFRVAAARLGERALANQAEARLLELLAQSRAAGSSSWHTRYAKSGDVPRGCSNVETTSAAILGLDAVIAD